MKDRSLVSWPILAGNLVFLAIALGCASTSTPQLPPTPGESISQDLADAPEWVSNCSSYWDDDDARVCAVGSMGGTANASLARTAAIARARTELSRVLEVKVEGMIKDYQSTTTGGGAFGVLSDEEQQVTVVSKQITDRSLSGTQQVASWISPSGTYWALIGLDVAKFSSIVSSMNSLAETTRAAVSERAQAAFEDLNRETADSDSPAE